MGNNKYKCLNSKCNNTIPRHNEMICNKCSCSMDVVCVDCDESVTTSDIMMSTSEGQLCKICWSKLTDGIS
jgi:hypothetical protein